MTVPVHIWFYDDGGSLIKGSCDVQDREGSVEIRGLTHNLSIPTDPLSGRLTGTRKHAPFLFEKEIDSSSPYLYKAVATGQNLKKVEIRYYRINNAGWEVEYFRTELEGVKVVSISPIVNDTRNCPGTREGANKRGNSSRLTQSFHFFMFEPIFSPVNALNQPI